MNDFLDKSIIGTIPNDVSNEMNYNKVIYNGKSVVTGSMFVNWWDIYIKINKLAEGNELTIDKKIYRSFKSVLLKYNVESNVQYSLFRIIIIDVISPIDYSFLSDKDREDLYEISNKVRDKFMSYFPDYIIPSI